jgi:hypothetical protein
MTSLFFPREVFSVCWKLDRRRTKNVRPGNKPIILATTNKGFQNEKIVKKRTYTSSPVGLHVQAQTMHVVSK